MESNHRFLGVDQASLPLDHGTALLQVESPGVAPGSPACGAGVVLLDHDPESGSRGTRTHKRLLAATCFQDRLLIRPDDFRSSKLRGLESNQHDDVQSVSSYRWMTPHRFSIETRIVSLQVRGGGVEPPSPGSKPGGLPLADPRSRSKSALRESNPPRQLGRLAPLPLGQGHTKAEGEGVEPSRLIARPLSRRLPSPVGLTFRIARLRWQESNLRRDA